MESQLTIDPPAGSKRVINRVIQHQSMQPIVASDRALIYPTTAGEPGGKIKLHQRLVSSSRCRFLTSQHFLKARNTMFGWAGAESPVGAERSFMASLFVE